LKNTKSDLEKERFVNAAIKQKKPICLVNQTTDVSQRTRRASTERLHHHCPPNEDTYRSHTQKKELSDKVKRKDYELKVLKKDLKEKQNELSSLSQRLSIVENSQLK
jgi:hypothetical protein